MLFVVLFFPFSVAASPNANLTVTIEAAAACADGVDNDSDGLTDFPGDLGCTSGLDNDETDPATGSGGSGGNISTRLFLSGDAYPNKEVYFTENSLTILSDTSNRSAAFSEILSDLERREYTLFVYSEDYQGIRSPLFPISFEIIARHDTIVDNIFIAPSISLDESDVMAGQTVTVWGQSVPFSTIDLKESFDGSSFLSTIANKDGIYSFLIDTTNLEGGYSFYTTAEHETTTSADSYTIVFRVTQEQIQTEEQEEVVVTEPPQTPCLVNGVPCTTPAEVTPPITPETPISPIIISEIKEIIETIETSVPQIVGESAAISVGFCPFWLLLLILLFILIITRYRGKKNKEPKK